MVMTELDEMVEYHFGIPKHLLDNPTHRYTCTEGLIEISKPKKEIVLPTPENMPPIGGWNAMVVYETTKALLVENKFGRFWVAKSILINYSKTYAVVPPKYKPQYIVDKTDEIEGEDIQF